MIIIWEIALAEHFMRLGNMVDKRFERFKPPSESIYPATQQNVSPGEIPTHASSDKVPNMSPALALTKFQGVTSQVYRKGFIQSGVI